MRARVMIVARSLISKNITDGTPLSLGYLYADNAKKLPAGVIEALPVIICQMEDLTDARFAKSLAGYTG